MSNVDTDMSVHNVEEEEANTDITGNAEALVHMLGNSLKIKLLHKLRYSCVTPHMMNHD